MTEADKFRNLDSWRGLAAIVVVLSHAYQIFISSFSPASLKFVGLFSQASVMIFFVLSGFLIGLSIRNNERRNGRFVLMEYAKSRIVRIYPPLLFSLFIMVAFYVVSPFFFDSGDYKLIGLSETIPAHYSMNIDLNTIYNIALFRNGFFSGGAQSNAALWSLPYEVWYYVIAALIMVRGRLAPLLAVLVLFYLSYKNSVFAYYGFVWGFGFVLSLLSKTKKNMVSAKTHYLIMLALAIACIFMCAIYIQSNTKQNLINYNISIGILFCSYLSLYVVHGKLGLPNISKTSEYSYSLYVIHFPILLFIYGCFESELNASLHLSIVLFVGASAASIITAKLSCKVFENKKIITSAIPFLK